jgi:hypothetical protein
VFERGTRAGREVNGYEIGAGNERESEKDNWNG